MANAKRCDRCGKFYMGGDIYRGPYAPTIAYTSCDNTTIKFDICESCLHSFVKFVDNERLRSLVNYDTNTSEEAPVKEPLLFT